MTYARLRHCGPPTINHSSCLLAPSQMSLRWGLSPFSPSKIVAASVAANASRRKRSQESPARGGIGCGVSPPPRGNKVLRFAPTHDDISTGDYNDSEGNNDADDGALAATNPVTPTMAESPTVPGRGTTSAAAATDDFIDSEGDDDGDDGAPAIMSPSTLTTAESPTLPGRGTTSSPNSTALSSAMSAPSPDGVATPAPGELLSLRTLSLTSIATRQQHRDTGRSMVIAEHNVADAVAIQSPASPIAERLPVVYSAAGTAAGPSPESAALQAGRQLFGDAFCFRAQQRECVEALVDGQSVVALHPTGHGKTLLLMIAARMRKPGVSIVFSPLLALMQDICDRVNALKQDNFRALYINGEMMGAAKRVVYSELSNLSEDSRLVLLMTAEMYSSSSEMFLTIMRLYNRERLSLIMTDEVHTVSEQGFGFRPSMLALGDVRRALPGECRPICSCTRHHRSVARSRLPMMRTRCPDTAHISDGH